MTSNFIICYFSRHDPLLSQEDENDDNVFESKALTPCEVGVGSNCGENERCLSRHKHSRNGFCSCVRGFLRNSDGDCVVSPTNNMLSQISPLNAQFLDAQDPSTQNLKVCKLYSHYVIPCTCKFILTVLFMM